MINNENLQFIMDYYELTMANGFMKSGIYDKTVYFDMFYRNVPDNGGYVIMAGLEQVVNFFKMLKFSADEIDFLRARGIFREDFLNYLKNFEFQCDVWAVPEGTPVFPNEPIITIKGPAIQVQMLETMVLLTINHQSLIATKASRIVRAAMGRYVSEFGSRRAHSYAAALYGARAAYIGGADSTACTLAGKNFGIPVVGTMAHSWVQIFPSELEAFRVYARQYPENCVLLIDTFSTLKSGLPNAIKVFKEEILPRGFRPAGVRIDSGDITYLSKKVRQILDDEGFYDCKIIVSNSLDEYIIRDMLLQGAKVDGFGVGERLITASSCPILDGVYKLCAVEENGEILPKIKISNNVNKINIPGVKELWRLYDNATGKALADVLTLVDEVIDDSGEYTIFDPQNPWKRKTIKNFKAVKLRKKIFEKGKLCYNMPKVSQIRQYCGKQLSFLWDEVKRFENPHCYYVDLSEKLWTQKQKLLSECAI